VAGKLEANRTNIGCWTSMQSDCVLNGHFLCIQSFLLSYAFFLPAKFILPALQQRDQQLEAAIEPLQHSFAEAESHFAAQHMEILPVGQHFPRE
jgi:hypothetical protein